MTSLNSIRICDVLSKDLALRDTADKLFEQINLLKAKEVVIDFSKVSSITRSFAHEYQLNKKETSKQIIETNVPQAVSKMFAITSKPAPKHKTINFTHAVTMTI